MCLLNFLKSALLSCMLATRCEGKIEILFFSNKVWILYYLKLKK